MVFIIALVNRWNSIGTLFVGFVLLSQHVIVQKWIDGKFTKFLKVAERLTEEESMMLDAYDAAEKLHNSRKPLWKRILQPKDDNSPHSVITPRQYAKLEEVRTYRKRMSEGKMR